MDVKVIIFFTVNGNYNQNEIMSTVAKGSYVELSTWENTNTGNVISFTLYAQCSQYGHIICNVIFNTLYINSFREGENMARKWCLHIITTEQKLPLSPPQSKRFGPKGQ